MSKIQQYLSNYAQDGTQQAIVLVGALTALGAYMNYREGKPLYGSMAHGMMGHGMMGHGMKKHGSMKRKASARNKYIGKRIKEQMAKGVCASTALKQASKEWKSLPQIAKLQYR
jgi:hypothetical protein